MAPGLEHRARAPSRGPRAGTTPAARDAADRLHRAAAPGAERPGGEGLRKVGRADPVHIRTGSPWRGTSCTISRGRPVVSPDDPALRQSGADRTTGPQTDVRSEAERRD